MDIHLFGDQTERVNSGLTSLLTSEKDPILDAFFARSYEAIRTELSRTSKWDWQPPSQYSSLLDLLVRRHSNSRIVPLDHALTTIYHLGVFIRRCHTSGGLYPEPSSSCLVGICIGSLAAAAISCTRSLSELLPIAVQAVVLSFHAGLLASDVSRRFYTASDQSGQSWAFKSLGLSTDRAVVKIDEFCEYHHLPHLSRPYVSSSSAQGATISGPPHVLSVFRQSEWMKGIKMVELPLHAPYHAKHLYSCEDVDSLLNLQTTSGWLLYAKKIHVISSATGQLVQGDDLQQIMRSVLLEIFRQPLQFDLTAKKLGIEKGVAEKTRLVRVSVSTARTIQVDLKAETNAKVKIVDSLSSLPGSENSHTTTSEPTGESPRTPRPEIAIVGMSGRFPGASNLDAFWDLLHRGLDVHARVPPLRWDEKTHVDTSGERKNTSATPYGCWLKQPDLFDPNFFGMSPREAAAVDPAQRLALLTAYEALEQAGVVPNSTPSTKRDRVGVCYGVTSNDWMETNSAQDIDAYFIPGGNRAFIPGRINYYFKFSGPSYSIDTACSSSLAAIQLACSVLWQGEADSMIAGGTNVLTNPDFTSGLDRGHFLSRTGNCKTFDESADGYCRGEGAASVVLKRLDDAIADNDPILGVILNTSTNHSAESESITRPYCGAQQSLFQKVLGPLEPSTVSYVEMHGTGTQIGDATEMTSVLNAFAPNVASDKRPENCPLHVGSVKPSVGHGEAAAGVTSLIKVLLMLQHNTIPPHSGIKTEINRKFPADLSSRGVYIAAQPKEWKKTLGIPRRVVVNNFSAAGGNTALLLQEPPDKMIEMGGDPRKYHLVAISAKTPSALQANARNLISFIRRVSETGLPLSSLSYTTTARRVHYAHRMCVSGSTSEELTLAISRAIELRTGRQRILRSPEIVFAFTGQGCHYLGMGKVLYNNIASFRADIRRYDQIAVCQGYPSILPIVMYERKEASTDPPAAFQLAIICLQMALVQMWRTWGIQPRAVIGHSLGHYAALHAAGVLSEADVIFLVGLRAQELDTRCPPETHCMLAVELSEYSIAPFLANNEVEIACINGPDQVVVGGFRIHIESLHSVLASKGIKGTILHTAYAYHTSQMDCILPYLKQATQGVTLRQPSIPVICSLNVSVINNQDCFGPSHFADHLRNPVRFLEALRSAKDTGLITPSTTFIEIGPASVLCRMIKTCLGDFNITLASLDRTLDTWRGFTSALSSLYTTGAQIDWSEYHRDFTRSLQVLSLPSYAWDLSSYWIEYKNDWSLRKGDPVLECRCRGSSIPSTTVHDIVEEKVDNKGVSIIVQTDLSRPALSAIVQGHKVNGLPLCTPSMYADIALTVAKHFQGNYQSSMSKDQIAVVNMTVEKALIAQPRGPQYLRASFAIDWQESHGHCRFSTVDSGGKLMMVHAYCSVHFSPQPAPAYLKHLAESTQPKIDKLREATATENAYRFNSSMIYRMVGSLAEFNADFRGLKEVVLDSKAMAAASQIDLTRVERSQIQAFCTHPAYIDAFCQSAGFIMNANDNSDLESEVFVNHGWDALRLYEDIQPNKSYHSWVQMTRKEETVWQGSLVIMSNNEVVGEIENIALQLIPRRLLQHVLSVANREQSRVNLPEDITDMAPKTALPVQGPEIRTKVTLDPPTKGNPAKNPQHTTCSGVDKKLRKLIEIVSEESGINQSQLSDETSFVTIGVDSLLSLIITSRLREELAFDIGPRSSIFDLFGTVGELKNELARSEGSNYVKAYCTSCPTSKRTPATASPVSTSQATTLDDRDEATLTRAHSAISPLQMPHNIIKPDTTDPALPCTSIILQRSSHPSPRTVFLFPDGSGSPYSYVHIPQVHSHLTIMGLICPYRHDPSAMLRSSFDAIMESYMCELRRVCQHGPYSLGGWSSGGILAFEAARRLMAAGEPVRHLVLIDSPAPTQGLQRLPRRFYKHARAVGLFGQAGAATATGGGGGGAPLADDPPPEWLIPHFKATIELLRDYRPEPLPMFEDGAGDAKSERGPKTSICWAGKRVFDGGRFLEMPEPDGSEGDDGDDDGEDRGDGGGMKFLTEVRTDFSPGAWAQLLPGLEVRVEVAEADHFGMMFGENAQALARFLERATCEEQEQQQQQESVWGARLGFIRAREP